MKKLYLVDVSSMFFRAFYAIRPLTSPSGLPTNAIYGFVSMIIKLLKDEKPDYLAFCYDRPEASFRSEIDPNYKAHRSETPPDLVPQIPYIKKIVDAMGISSFEKAGFEADDLIGSLVHFAKDHHIEVVIVSGDKDFAQLVEPRVSMLDTMKDARFDSQAVKEKWGVRPDQFLDYLALVGDSSDNIPGVDGIGTKGAAKLLEEHESLDQLYSHLDKILSKSLKAKLEAGKESADLSRRLARIKTDIDLSISLKDLLRQPVHREELQEILRELNFKSFEKTLLGDGLLNDRIEVGEDRLNSELPPKTHNLPMDKTSQFNVHFSQVDVAELRKILKQGDSVWAFQNARGYFIHCENQGSHLLQLMGDYEPLGKVLSEMNLRWSGFDIKTICRDLGVKRPTVVWDSLLAGYILKTDQVESFESAVREFLHIEVPSLLMPEEELSLHLKLQDYFQVELTQFDPMKVYETIELPLIPILLKMEQEGIKVDTQLLAKQSQELAKDIRDLEKAIHEGVGEVFNIGSPKQLGHILFDKMKIPPLKKTKTGYSTDSDVLEKLKADYPVVQFILEYRELTKLKSTYVDALPALVNPATGRVHTHFNQALTSTGRLSSTQPNLQNIPIRTSRGASIRKAFIAKEGCSLISIDYSQIELRLLAHITEDPGLCRAFENNLDIHQSTASQIFKVPLDEVTSKMRRSAKAVNFGIAYGQGAFGLAENLGVPRKEAQEIIDRYFQEFKRVREYMQETIELSHRQGYVTTLFGRRRKIPELSSRSPMIRKFGERAAINAPIQGGAADLVKKAMIQVAELESLRTVSSTLLLQVHDELIFETPIERAESDADTLSKAMEQVVKLRVPLAVHTAIGPNWSST